MDTLAAVASLLIAASAFLTALLPLVRQVDDVADRVVVDLRKHDA